jgi:transcriptional regulator with XRE-family HTH domain
MINLIRGRRQESASERVQSQEVDELHFLSEQVYHRRMAEDWSQDALSEVAGMTQAQVALVEAGRANPTVRTLVKVACALRCTVGDLFQPVKYETIAYSPAARWTKDSLEPLSFDLMLRLADVEIENNEVDDDLTFSVKTCEEARSVSFKRVAWWTGSKPVRAAVWADDEDVRTIVVRGW